MNIYLGRNREGELIKPNLNEVQHLLIAGVPGTGKSIYFQAIIKNLMDDHTPDEVRFCLFSDVYFLLKPYIKDEYYLYPNGEAIAKSEEEFAQLLDRILAIIEEREKSGVNNAPQIVLLCDENYPFFKDETQLKGIEILKRGNAVGVHMIYSFQLIPLKERQYEIQIIRNTPTLLVGETKDPRRRKIVLGEKNDTVLNPNEFILKGKTLNDIVHCEYELYY